MTRLPDPGGEPAPGGESEAGARRPERSEAEDVRPTQRESPRTPVPRSGGGGGSPSRGAGEVGKPAGKKPSTLERMATVVSHELRNPLAVINNSVYYLRARIGEKADEKVSKHLAIIESEIQRADSIISEIYSFAKKTELRPERVRPAELVEAALKACPAPESVRVETSAAPSLPEVSVDAAKMTKALAALLRNGIEAMASGGKLTVSAEAADSPEAPGKVGTAGLPPRQAEGGVRFLIADTGPGLPPAGLEEAFEPFFTTKARNIGLGLTNAKQIVEAHGGRLELKSAEGKGAIAIVWLPAA